MKLTRIELENYRNHSKMNMSKFTPGPWRTKGRIIEQFNSALGIGIRPLASLPKYEDAEANARLIAAAPELLDAARVAAQYLRETNGSRPRTPVEALLLAAIAKTEGRE